MWIALALMAGAGAAHAQDRTLDRVQNMIETGRLTEARNTLNAWERDNGNPLSEATPDDRARALYLTGALSTDAKAAEDAFIGVVLGYPSSPVAPDALLRLGQSLYAAGENDRALTYLQRLRSDYPGSPQRETGMLWLTRAQLAGGNAAAACGTARETLFNTTNENVRTLIEIERDRACAQSGGVASTADRADVIMPQRSSNADSLRAAARAARLEQSARDQEARDQATREQSARDQATREQSARDQSARDQSARDQAARERAARDQAARAAQPAPAPTTVVTTPARPATPLPDLGIAVDPNVREPTPRDEIPARSSADAGDTTPAARTPASTDSASLARAAQNANTSEFAVQSAAFAERRAAETIAREMRAKGLDARIVLVPGNPYFRVRHGSFATSAEAAAAALRVRDAGFATLVVNDVRLERAP
jgi:cell division protein FtsN